jgi:hypothetical protein
MLTWLLAVGILMLALGLTILTLVIYYTLRDIRTWYRERKANKRAIAEEEKDDPGYH